jgi:transcriptional regulator with XRE-family HTH domain
MNSDKHQDASEMLSAFGKHLANVRKSRGWSQEKLALESGIARSYLSGVERGQRNIALVNICRLATTLEISTDELMKF